VHVHGFTKVLSASVVKAAIDSGHPVVLTLHDYFAACPNGGFFNYQTNEICPLVPLSRKCVGTHCDIRSYPQKLWRVSRTAVQKHHAALPSGIGHFISPSQTTGEILRPYLPHAARLHVIPNPVSGPELEAVQPAGNDPFVFLGRLEPDKGPVVLAEAARRARVPVVFVGAGQEAEAVRRANPEAELTGWLPPEAAQARLRGARAVVNASLWYETQGLSVLEAASHGVPAVVSDRTVLKEAVADGDTGLWFRGGDVGDLAEKLGALQASDGLVARLGASAFRRFKAGRFDLGTHLDRLEAVYAESLGAA
jgi:glycosyltransferase involved in cell wall biosynthesis